ncbi:MAG: type 2 isopentenyl-diphosphate Delta-isomerase [Bradymonadaceae bacterium]
MADSPKISDRKADHLALCAEQDVEARRKTTLLEEVELLHDSLPELDVESIDLGVEVLGKSLAAPLLITGMTGGADEAQEINRVLAQIAEELGIAFGVGSQRAMLDHKDLKKSYQVRDVAPTILLFGNIGAVQAANLSTAKARDLVGAIEADALCIHLNPGQELIQPEGDRDFRGCLEAITRLHDELDVPVIVKETGCGLSPRTLDKIRSTGVDWVDTSGAGGTTWIGVESMRTDEAPQKTLGALFWDWGIPTAPSIVYARERDFSVIASGGLRDGLDAARAIALGANLCGMALPWLRAAHEGGLDGARAFGASTLSALRTACLLTGSSTIEELRDTPKVLGPKLERWLGKYTAVKGRKPGIGF